MAKAQTAKTRDNIRKARLFWQEKQDRKAATRAANAEARAKRGDKGQLAHLDKLGLTAAKERAKLHKRLEGND